MYRSTSTKRRIVDKEGQARPLVLNEEKIVVTGNDRSGTVVRMASPRCRPPSLLLTTVPQPPASTAYAGRKTLWGIDLALFFAAGTAGCILAFLALFSQHPAVSPNYLLFVFHPLHLFCLPLYAEQGAKKEKKPLYAGEFCCFNTFYSALGS